MSNTTFFEKSKEIANDFIQSIVFLDDKAYRNSDNENTAHDFDALKISKIFAKENKICAVYRPESEKDIEDFKSIADKADCVILDWQIDIKQEILKGSEEDDAPYDDYRGLYTKEIIKSILFDEGQQKDSLKIIIIYTGDYTLLEDISTSIYSDVFSSSSEYTLNLKDCSIQSSHVKVIVRAKEVKIAAASNREKYENFMINYESLPSFILDEFTHMTSGLLSNFALMSLTTLRKNSSKILGLFSKEMDSAYLSHKALLPSQEDAEDLLIDLFGDTIADLLLYNKINEEIRGLIQGWIDLIIKIEHKNEVFKKKGKADNITVNYIRNHALLVDLVSSKNKDVGKRYIDAFSKNAGLSKTKAEEYYDYISNNNITTQLFLNNSEMGSQQGIDQRFSILTHHKSLFIPSNTIHKLTLGTVVKSTVVSDKYYICIQQRCDSVRIQQNTDRKFLFIPLKISDGKFDIITPEGVRLKKVNDSFSIRTIKFVCTNDYGVIVAEKDDKGKPVFTQKYTDEQFEWILDLKDLHAQRIIIDYTTKLSRVGLDESEWHRKYLS